MVLGTPIAIGSNPRKPGGTPAPLRPGEHLARGEFERRWPATPGLRRAELIEGIVFMPSPVSEPHAGAHGCLFRYLDRYAEATPGVAARLNASLRLDLRNEFQPDCLLRIESPVRGRSRITPDDYLEGAPELVAEIAVTSADYDAHEKRDVYERMGVAEYNLWRVLDSRCDWWTLHDGTYEPITAHPDGTTRSVAFPDLWLDLQALQGGDHRRLGTVLARGLRSAPHTAFRRRLAAA
jgi:Uma2 family endonuclease